MGSHHFSVTNCGTKEHYQINFFALFTSPTQECEQWSQSVVDIIFAVVMDFSEAEAAGFVHRFLACAQLYLLS
jgi:hypothetical protein